MAATLYYSNILGYCISVDEKLLSFQNKWYAQGFNQAILLISVFWTKIEFLNVAKCRWGSQGTVSSAADS